MLSNLKVVMVNTTHPGNIGSAARAMKTMGVSQLVLVSPKEFPSDRAMWLASGATDILRDAVVVDTLEEAVADCPLVIGTSARLRRIPWPLMNPRQCGDVIAQESETHPVALVFGREAMGLSNEELRMCNYHVQIPSNPEYGVLNVAAAVQVLCYEARMAHLLREGEVEEDSEFKMPMEWTRWDDDLASSESVEHFLKHFEETLLDIEFFDPENPRQLLTRLRRLYIRARMDTMEVSMMRGILRRVQEMVREENKHHWVERKQQDE